jgi:hypothetical protein
MCSCASEPQNELRAERLLDAIKIETRWQLLARGSSTVDHNGGHVGPMRKALLSEWPKIRARRMTAAQLVDYYTFAATRAEWFSLLISIRRAREHARETSQ